MNVDDETQATAAASADSMLLLALLSAHFAQQRDPKAAADAMAQLCDEGLLAVEARVNTGDPQRDMLAAELARRFVQARVRSALALATRRPSKP